ncbi:MAG: FecR domain-containing protein [Pseudomonadota bacterium]
MAENWDQLSATAHDWRARRQEGLDPETEAEFQSWYHADPAHAEAYSEALLFWESAGLPGYAEDLKQRLEELPPAQALPTTTSSYEQNVWLSRALAGVTALAAAIVLAVLVESPDYLFRDTEPQFQRFATEGKETKRLMLPDGSVIVLGSRSVFELVLTDTKRHGRLLEGDALLTIAANAKRPFIVETSPAMVEVTGTKFDLRLGQRALSVAVGEGSVLVSDLNPSQIRRDAPAQISLKAGQAVSVSEKSGLGEVTEVFPAEIGAWSSGRLIYYDASLSQVVEDLNRYTDVPIVLDRSAANLRIDGAFDTKDMDFVFLGIEQSLAVRIERSDERVTIRRR